MREIKRPPAYLAVFFTFLIQVFISNFLGTSAIKPNLMIIMTAYFALFTDRKFGLEIGLLSGILLDIFSIRFFGLNAILFALGGYLIGKYNNKFYRGSIITHIIFTFTLSVFILSLYFLFVNQRILSPSPRIGLNAVFSTPLFITSLLNSFLGIWIYAFLSRVFRLSEGTL